MNKLSILILILIFAAMGVAQKATKIPNFDPADFSKKFETVEWLVEYDNVAWKTTDVLLKQDQKELHGLGKEWFCFQDKAKLWHAVYGKFSDGKYELAFHFTMDANEKITKTDAKIDQDFLNMHATALATGRAKLIATIPADSPVFNQYIKQNADKTFSVWLLPAFQTNGMAVYGGEAIYNIDSSGSRILKDESYFQKDFRGFKTTPPREIWLQYQEMQKPSLGAIFFAWYYKEYFTSISIDNAKVVSTPVKTDKEYIWVNVIKDEDDKSSSEPINDNESEKPIPVKLLEIGNVSGKEFKHKFNEHKDWKDCDSDNQLYIINYGTDKQIEQREKLEVDLLSDRGYDCARRTLVRGGAGNIRTVIWKIPPGADYPTP